MELNRLIDHTLLKPESTREQILKVVEEAKQYHFATVMVNPYWISMVAPLLEGTDVLPACVIGFPLGANTKAVKVFETQDAIANGAKEIDMVINIGELKGGNDAYVIDEIRAVKETCGDLCLKVIIETCLLSEEEKKRATRDVVAAGADFVKTSTGFSTAGATVEDVRLMKKETEGSSVLVKAAGGVRNHDDLVAMVEAGAARIGTSRGTELF